ncbi:hypothetical protein ABZ690_19040 [Streptomyces sp. NPDC006967]
MRGPSPSRRPLGDIDVTGRVTEDTVHPGWTATRAPGRTGVS